MALKAEHIVFIQHYKETQDHIASYIKAVPGTDRKKAATCGKRWLNKSDIAAELNKVATVSTAKPVEADDLSTQLEKAAAALPIKQRTFCEEYLIDLNGTQAAIRSRYSKKSASETASELLVKSKIKAYIDLLMKVRAQRTEITPDRVLQELAAIAFANINDFVKVVEKEEVGGSKTDLGDQEEEKRTHRVVEVFPTDTIDKAKIPALSSIKQGRSGIEVKMFDKEKALELLGRHLGMWNDKLQLGADDELKALYKTVMNGGGK
ncbi:terminase small subunit [Chitinophaga japonensis]|uniref:Terminase small subunit n=1 Tax=Chitinophaga japonensis TaxID=104662 RepID=A0A562SYR6_CHIJA|nr:terminase small subunit [Chitinophaga japonensis]TWI86313.1 terminase small subunit [Chitinophaga japonensis]